NACYGVDQNHFYGNEVYENEVYGNAKYSKPYRGVCRNGTRRNAIYTNGARRKVYNHHKPENKSGGYIKNDLYMPHCTGTRKATTTSDDQMDLRRRRLDLAKGTDCKRAYGMSPKQRMGYGRQNFGFS